MNNDTGLQTNVKYICIALLWNLRSNDNYCPRKHKKYVIFQVIDSYNKLFILLVLSQPSGLGIVGM